MPQDATPGKPGKLVPGSQYGFYATACTCTERCEAYYENGLPAAEQMPRCVMFMSRSGRMEVLHCGPCRAGTWHQQGKCILCGAADCREE